VNVRSDEMSTVPEAAASTPSWKERMGPTSRIPAMLKAEMERLTGE